jgi:hypothetical protein
MFAKYKFKSLLILVLALCVNFATCDWAVAQNTASFVQMRSLPPVTPPKHPEIRKAARLITIKEEKPLPPKRQLSRARIVSKKSTKAPVPTQPQSKVAVAPLSPKELVSPPVPPPQSNVVENLPSANVDSSLGYYTVSFANSAAGPQSEEDLSALESESEPDSPILGQLETEDPTSDGNEEDRESSEADDLDLADDESADELNDVDENDTPVAQAEFGRWPSKSIQEVYIDLAEYGDEVPEDRSSKLYESSQRFDGNIPATEKVFAWAAPNIGYQQLYFEDVALERYGQTKGLVKQPFVSAGRFLADTYFLTTRAFRDCPGSCDSPLGFCRPGSPSTIANGSGCGCAFLHKPQGECKSCQ